MICRCSADFKILEIRCSLRSVHNSKVLDHEHASLSGGTFRPLHLQGAKSSGYLCSAMVTSLRPYHGEHRPKVSVTP
jgi:hypothetical protein